METFIVNFVSTLTGAVMKQLRMTRADYVRAQDIYANIESVELSIAQ